jgi:predicted AlkP superfamily pyrophosphatase or phosphodiesterase
MLNQESVAAVAASRFGGSQDEAKPPRFVRPIYDGYGYARIPATVERLLTGAGPAPLPAAALAGLAERHDTVILLLLDAFGWRFFAPRLERYPFLRRFLKAGVVSQLTTMFPSTTSAHVTALHTGLDPAASGVYEWFIYEPGLNRVVAPLLFSFAGEHTRETLAEAGVDPAAIFPSTTLYQRLADAGVAGTVFQHASYAGSSGTRVICDGATVLGYRTLPEALTTLAERLAAQQGPAYYQLYVDTFDTICHLHGPESPHAEAELDTILTTLERLLHPALERLARPALLLLTADHGQIAIDPKRAHFVDRLLPELVAATPTGADGRPVAPSGSSRDLFLYVHEERLDGIQRALTNALAGRAEVHRTADLIAAGLFGPEPSPRFLARVGNLVALPYAGETVWWDDRRFNVRFRGSHGGLTPEEALTELAALQYG